MAKKGTNSGNWNSGYGNSGDCNSGYGNSGDYNSGDCNSGNWNSGNGNSGNWNSGYGNSGDYNSGDCNSGYWNSGNGNSTNIETGLFNSKQGTIRCFNKDSGKRYNEIDRPHFIEFYLEKWVDEEDMTDKEKIEEPEFHVRGGYLKTFEYKEAWKNFWKDTDEENRQKFLNLPNFDSKIFYEITGIDVDKEHQPKTVEITCEGKTVEISRESAKALNLIK